MTAIHENVPKNPLILCCHGVYHQGMMYSEFPEDRLVYENQLRQLDRWMRKQVCKYFWRRYRVRLGVKELRQAGMKSLVREYYRQRKISVELCTCENQDVSDSC